MQEITKLRKSFNKDAKIPNELAQRKTAILWNHKNWWDIEFQKQTSQWNTFNHLSKYLDGILGCGAPVDIIGEENNFSDYKILIVPAYQLVDSALVERWTKYVREGGHLVLSCRTAQKNRNGHLWQAKWASPILKLIGAEIDFFDLMLPQTNGIVKFNGKEYVWNNWADVLTPSASITSLAIYSNQYYAGKSAIVSRKLGLGTVTYVGVDSEDGVLEKDVLLSVYKQAGITSENYPKGVYVYWREGFFIAVNYSTSDYEIATTSNMHFLVGDKTLKPADVAVWN